MSIILGIIVPALLFLITLPLQSFLFLLRNSLKVIEIREKRKGKGSLGNKLGLSKGSDKLRSELGLSPKKNNNSMLAKITSKMKIASLKAMQLAIRAVSMLVSLLRTVASTLITLVITAVMMMLPVCLAVIIATSSIVMFYKGSTSTTLGNSSISSVVSSNTSSSKGNNSSSLSNNDAKDLSVRYLQGDYSSSSDVISNGKRISKCGCGWCTMTHMMAVLNPKKCKKITPRDWISKMPDSVKKWWAGGSMDWAAPDAWINAINAKGDYGKYKIVARYTNSSYSDSTTKEVFKLAKKYLHDDNTVMIVSSSTGMFTTGGHIILMTTVGEKNNYFTITDSASGKNSAPQTLINSGKGSSKDPRSAKWNKFKFPMNVTSYCGKHYHLKAGWVVKRVK